MLSSLEMVLFFLLTHLIDELRQKNILKLDVSPLSEVTWLVKRVTGLPSVEVFNLNDITQLWEVVIHGDSTVPHRD